MKKPAFILVLSLMLFNLMACSDSKPAPTEEKQEITTSVETPTSSVSEKAETEPSSIAISENTEITPSAKAEDIITKPKKEVLLNQAPKQVLQVNEPVKIDPGKSSNNDKVKKEMLDEAKERLEKEMKEKKVEEVKRKKEVVDKEKAAIQEKIQAPATKEVAKANSVKQILSHDQWDQLLRKHVSAAGKVNYKGFKADLSKLDAYLKNLQDNPIESKWSRNQKMAYWVNAYNAFTVKLIVDNYPTSSITKLHGGKPWDASWIKIAGKSYSLNNIENDILRPQYKDARIHFAVNCAARSCPPILNRAWTSENLNRYFEKQAKAFINNTKYNKISADNVEISKIFEWYAADFGSITEYLNKYSSTKVKPGAKVTYMEYDWNLNE